MDFNEVNIKEKYNLRISSSSTTVLVTAKDENFVYATHIEGFSKGLNEELNEIEVERYLYRISQH